MNTNTPQSEVPGTQAQPSALPQMPSQPTMAQPQYTQSQEPVRQGTSEDTKTLVTVLLLIFVTPIGLLVMFFWPKWKWWVKLLVAVPAILAAGFMAIFLLGALVAVNPSKQIERAECMNKCTETNTTTECTEMCAVPDAIETPAQPETGEMDAVGVR